MKTITIEELEALKDAEKTIVDIRPQDQYMRGTFPGAVSLPASRLEEQYEEETARLDKMHPVYVMCHTGEKSQEWVRRGQCGGWLPCVAAPLPLTLRRRRIRGGSGGKTGEN